MYVLSLSSELVKLAFMIFLTHVTASEKFTYFKRPLAGAEFGLEGYPVGPGTQNTQGRKQDGIKSKSKHKT
jgi:hypothetical protein